VTTVTTVQEAREKLGLTRAELARKLKVARSTVTRWEAGTRTVPPGKLKMLRQMLGTDRLEALQIFAEIYGPLVGAPQVEAYLHPTERHSTERPDPAEHARRQVSTFIELYSGELFQKTYADGLQNAFAEALANPLVRQGTPKRHFPLPVPTTRLRGVKYFLKRGYDLRHQEWQKIAKEHAEILKPTTPSRSSKSSEDISGELMSDAELKAKVERDDPNAVIMELQRRRDAREWLKYAKPRKNRKKELEEYPAPIPEERPDEIVHWLMQSLTSLQRQIVELKYLSDQKLTPNAIRRELRIPLSRMYRELKVALTGMRLAYEAEGPLPSKIRWPRQEYPIVKADMSKSPHRFGTERSTDQRSNWLLQLEAGKVARVHKVEMPFSPITTTDTRTIFPARAGDPATPLTTIRKLSREVWLWLSYREEARLREANG
jgi:transcriptional regulator with XRE-family HTH domain